MAGGSRSVACAYGAAARVRGPGRSHRGRRTVAYHTWHDGQASMARLSARRGGGREGGDTRAPWSATSGRMENFTRRRSGALAHHALLRLWRPSARGGACGLACARRDRPVPRGRSTVAYHTCMTATRPRAGAVMGSPGPASTGRCLSLSSAPARVRPVRVHAPWDGPSCGMLFSTPRPVSHTDLQEDTCLRKARNRRRTCTIPMATVTWTGPPSSTPPTPPLGPKSGA